MKPTAPPEAFTREHAVDDEQPGLPEHTATEPGSEDWLRRWNESNALDRERDTMRALDEAGVPAGVPIRPGVVSHFPADRVRWLAQRAKGGR